MGHRRGKNIIPVIVSFIGKLYRRLPFRFTFIENLHTLYWKEYGKFNQRVRLYFEIQITDHCNLNCVSCSHFSPLADEKFLDIIDAENDFAQLSKLGEKRIYEIHLMGGEPLLHPLIINIMILARKYFANTKIDIVTNGILLLKQTDDFWSACRQYNIGIHISSYPIKLDYEKIKHIAEKHKVVSVYNNTPEDIQNRSMWKMELDIDGTQNIFESFKKCGQANQCTNLLNGKIYPCPTIAYIHIFNKYFDKDFKVCEQDYIDIYKTKTIDEIMNFLCNPVPFCRYCKNNFPLTKWHISKKDISEWV